jgi:hypothetical protein
MTESASEVRKIENNTEIYLSEWTVSIQQSAVPVFTLKYLLY